MTDSPEASRPSLRIRKAERTRRIAAETARRLFTEQGFDQTSLDEIADAADLSVSTLLRYFQSKERLAMARRFESFDIFEDHMSGRPELPVFDRWRSFVELSTLSDRTFDEWKSDHDLISSVPALTRLDTQLWRSYEDRLTREFSTEAGVASGDDLYSRMLAALLIAGNLAVFREWIADGGTKDLRLTCLEVIDFAHARLGQQRRIDLS